MSDLDYEENRDGDSGKRGGVLHSRLVIATVFAIVAFMELRFAASLQELWLDEIWGIRIVEPLTAATQIWTRVRTDNHVLYSIYLYFVGGQATEWLYRLPSVLAGTGSMVLAGLIAREQLKRDRLPRETSSVKPVPSRNGPTRDAAGLIAVLLFGFSYLIFHYDSEARGYALCVCFCLLAFLLLLRGEGERHSKLAIGYWAAIAMAILAQPIAIHMLAAGGAWSCWHWLRTRSRVKDAAAEAVWWHLIPTVFFALFYLAYVRLLNTGGADAVSLVAGSSGAWAYTLGLPIKWGASCLLVGGLLTTAGLVNLIRHRNDLWIFYVAAVVVSPWCLTLLRHSPYNYERYFIVNAALALLLIGNVLARVLLSGRVGRLVFLTLLTLFALGNIRYDVHLLRHGRGQYHSVIDYIMKNSHGTTVTLSSDHDFRHTMPIGFYLQRHADLFPRHLRYCQQSARPLGGTEWLVTHDRESGSPHDETICDKHGNTYDLRKTYPSSYLAGFRIYLYQLRGGVPDE